MKQKIEQHQIDHLSEHVDQLVAKAGVTDVEQFCNDSTSPQNAYKALCDLLDVEPLPSKAQVADEKAEKAFKDMTGREHRKAAQHLTLCPAHGFVGASRGVPMTTISDKIASLQEQRDRLLEAVKHLDAGIDKYSETLKD